MASSEDSCDGNPDFAVICSFITNFGDECGVNITIPDLQQMLEDTKNVHEDLSELHIHLLRRGRKRVTKEKWEKSLIKFCHEYSSVDAWELERFGYKKSKLSVKLELLKRLLELQFDSNPKFKAEINKHDAKKLRIPPVGRDIDGQCYWYQLDKDYNFRLYRQGVGDESSWQLLCSTTDHMKNLLASLEKFNTDHVSNEKPSDDASKDVEEIKMESSSDELKAHISESKPCSIIIKTEKKDSLSRIKENAEKDSPIVHKSEIIPENKAPEPKEPDKKSEELDDKMDTSVVLIKEEVKLNLEEAPMEIDSKTTASSTNDMSKADIEVIDDKGPKSSDSQSLSVLKEDSAETNISPKLLSLRDEPPTVSEPLPSEMECRRNKLKMYEKWSNEKLQASASKLVETPKQNTNSSGISHENLISSLDLSPEKLSVDSKQSHESALNKSKPPQDSVVRQDPIREDAPMDLSVSFRSSDPPSVISVETSPSLDLSTGNKKRPLSDSEMTSHNGGNQHQSSFDSPKSTPSEAPRPFKKKHLSMAMEEARQDSSHDHARKSVIFEVKNNKLFNPDSMKDQPLPSSGFSHLQALQNMCNDNPMTCFQGSVIHPAGQERKLNSDGNLSFPKYSPHEKSAYSEGPCDNLSKMYKFNYAQLSGDVKPTTPESGSPSLLLKSNVCSTKGTAPKMESTPKTVHSIASLVANTDSCKDRNSVGFPKAALHVNEPFIKSGSDISPKDQCSIMSPIKDPKLKDQKETLDLCKQDSAYKMPVAELSDVRMQKKSPEKGNHSIDKIIDKTPSKKFPNPSADVKSNETCSKLSSLSSSSETSNKGLIASDGSHNFHSAVPSLESQASISSEFQEHSLDLRGVIKESNKELKDETSESVQNNLLSAQKDSLIHEQSQKESPVKNACDNSVPVLKTGDSMQKDSEVSKSLDLGIDNLSKNKGNQESIDSNLSMDKKIPTPELKDSSNTSSSSVKSDLSKEKIPKAPSDTLIKIGGTDEPKLSNKEQISEPQILSDDSTKLNKQDTALESNQAIKSSSDELKCAGSEELNVKHDSSAISKETESSLKSDISSSEMVDLEKNSTMEQNVDNKTQIFSSGELKDTESLKVTNTESLATDIKEANEKMDVDLPEAEKMYSVKDKPAILEHDQKGEEKYDKQAETCELTSKSSEDNVDSKKSKIIKASSEAPIHHDEVLPTKEILKESKTEIMEEVDDTKHGVNKDRPEDIHLSTMKIGEEVKCQSTLEPTPFAKNEDSLEKVLGSENLENQKQKINESSVCEMKEAISTNLGSSDELQHESKEAIFEKSTDVSKDSDSSTIATKEHVSKKDTLMEVDNMISDESKPPLPDSKVDFSKETVKEQESEVAMEIGSKPEDSLKTFKKEHDKANEISPKGDFDANCIKVDKTESCNKESKDGYEKSLKITKHKSEEYQESSPQKIISMDDCESGKDVPKDESKSKEVSPKDDSKSVEAISKDVSKPVEDVSKDSSKPVEDVSKDSSKPVETVPKDVSECMESVSKDVSKIVDTVSKDDSKPAEAISKDDSKPAEAISKDDSKPAKAISKDDSKPAKAISKDDSKPAKAVSKDDSKPAKTISKDDSKPAKVISKDDSKSVEAVTKDDSKPAEAISKDDSKPAKVISKDDSKSAEAVTKDDSKPAEAVSKDISKPVKTVSKDISKPVKTVSNDISKPVEAISKDSSKSVETVSKDVTEPAESILKGNSNSVESFSSNSPDLMKSIPNTDTKSEVSVSKDSSKLKINVSKDASKLKGTILSDDSNSEKIVSKDNSKTAESDLKKISKSKESASKIDSVSDQNDVEFNKTVTKDDKSDEVSKDKDILKDKDEMDSESSKTQNLSSQLPDIDKKSPEDPTEKKHSKEKTVEEVCKAPKNEEESMEVEMKEPSELTEKMEVETNVSECAKEVGDSLSKEETVKDEKASDTSLTTTLKSKIEDSLEIYSYMRGICHETKFNHLPRVKPKPVASASPTKPNLITSFSMDVTDDMDIIHAGALLGPLKKKRGRLRKDPQPTPPKARQSKAAEPKKPETDSFTIPEGFLEILEGEGGGKKDPPPRKSRGRKKLAISTPSVHSSESESAPIKRSSRIQAQQKKKMSELAVEMEKEQRMLELLAKKSSLAPKKVVAKTPPAKEKGAKGSKVAKSKFEPPTPEETCMEIRKPRKMNSRSRTITKMTLMYEDESKDSEFSTSRETEKSKRGRRRGRGSGKKGHKPWDVSSESESSIEEITEEEEEEEEPEEPLVFEVNEDEFACEEVDEDAEIIVVRRARTAKKVRDDSTAEEPVVNDDKPCRNCGKYDQPEWILLCDKCDNGYHTHCLKPPLTLIPDGDWYCQPCEHMFLCEWLQKEVHDLELVIKQREREELRKQRLAYVGISLDNVLKPEKKEKSDASSNEEDSEEEEVESKGRSRESSDDERHKKIYGKRSVRARRTVNYQFKEYDALIASAIQDEIGIDEVKLTEDEEEHAVDKEEEEDKPFKAKLPRTRKKTKRLNDLDFSDEDIDSGDEYKGSSSNSEQTAPPSGSESRGSGESGEWTVSKSKGKVKSKSRRGRRGGSSDEDWEDENDSDSCRPTTRRAARKAVSYRELSSDEEWSEKPKKAAKKRKKETSSEESDASYKKKKPKQTKRKSRVRKWASSDSSEESDQSMSFSGDDSSQKSEDEWRVKKSSGVNSRLKVNINKKVLSSEEDEEEDGNENEESSRESKKAKKPAPKKKVVPEEEEESEEDEEEEGDEEDEESEDEEDEEEDEESEEETKSKPVEKPKVKAVEKPAPPKPVEKPTPKPEAEKPPKVVEQPKVVEKTEPKPPVVPPIPDLAKIKAPPVAAPVPEKAPSLPPAPARTVKKDTTKMVPCVIPYDKSPKTGLPAHPEEEGEKERARVKESGVLRAAPKPFGKAPPPKPYNPHLTVRPAPVDRRPFKSTIIQPFSNIEDDGIESDDEVPLERIPTHVVPTPPAPTRRESEYIPAAKGFSYTAPEEKCYPLPPTYSTLTPFQDYGSRPSPLKPSLVETYSNSSSPSKLTPLDSYSQTSSPKGFISLDSYSESRKMKKQHFYGNQPTDHPDIHPSRDTYHPQGGEIRFPPEPYPCTSSPGTYQRTPPPPGTPPRLYSQYQDSYAPPRSPDYYQTHQYYSDDRVPRPSGYQPNYVPPEPSFVTNPYVATPVPQPNGGFMIDTLLRARNPENEEDELTEVTDIVSYITQE